MKKIQQIYDTPYIEDWIDKQITIYVEKIKAYGEDNVECLRIRKIKPVKQELIPSHQKWNSAIKGLKNKTVTMSQLKNHYIISEQNETLLING